jgi:hypothetical protein
MLMHVIPHRLSSQWKHGARRGSCCKTCDSSKTRSVSSLLARSTSGATLPVPVSPHARSSTSHPLSLTRSFQFLSLLHLSDISNRHDSTSTFFTRIASTPPTLYIPLRSPLLFLQHSILLLYWHQKWGYHRQFSSLLASLSIRDRNS